MAWAERIFVGIDSWLALHGSGTIVTDVAECLRAVPGTRQNQIPGEVQFRRLHAGNAKEQKQIPTDGGSSRKFFLSSQLTLAVTVALLKTRGDDSSLDEVGISVTQVNAPLSSNSWRVPDQYSRVSCLAVMSFLSRQVFSDIGCRGPGGSSEAAWRSHALLSDICSTHIPTSDSIDAKTKD